MLRKLLAASLLLFACAIGEVRAQSIAPVILPSGCGTGSFTPGPGYLTMDSVGRLCESIGGNTAGSFTPLSPMQAGLAITSATSLTAPSGATYAVACAAGQSVNYTTDGTTTPTASVGMPLAQGQCLTLSGASVIANFKAIQQSATATLNVSYFK